METEISNPRSREAIDKSIVELDCPDEEMKVGNPSFKTIILCASQALTMASP